MQESAAFGKGKKTSEANAQCFLVSAHDWLLSTEGVKTKYSEKFQKYLERMKGTVSGPVSTPASEAHLHKIALTFAKHQDMLKTLILRAEEFVPTMRKGVFSVIIELILFEAKADEEGPYICFFDDNFSEIMDFLLAKYPDKLMTPYCGETMRSFTRVPILLKKMQNFELLERLKPLLLENSFDVSSDAFSVVSNIFMVENQVGAGKLLEMSAGFIEANHANIFEFLNALIYKSDSYFARRESLKMLFGLIATPEYELFLLNFLGDLENTQNIMKLLCDKQKGIQLEALRVFSLIAKESSKNPEIVATLLKNKDKLTEYIKSMLPDRHQESVMNGKELILGVLKEL